MRRRHRHQASQRARGARFPAALLLALGACSGDAGPEPLALRVVDVDGAPLANAEVLYLRQFFEEPYGGISVPPIPNARALATRSARTGPDGAVPLELYAGDPGGLLVLADGHLPGGFLLDDDFRHAADGAGRLALRPGQPQRARAIAPTPSGEEGPVAGLQLSTWLHNKATLAYGHDLLLYAEEVEPALYEFPALDSLLTPWTDGELREVATVHLPGYSATGALRGDDEVFVVELGVAPRTLRVVYDPAGLAPSMLLEVHGVSSPADQALPPREPGEPPGWCAYGVPMHGGEPALRAVSAAGELGSLVFFVHMGAPGSRIFAIPAEEAQFGPDAPPVDLTDKLRVLAAEPR